MAGHLDAADSYHLVLFDDPGHRLNAFVSATDLQFAFFEFADQIGVATCTCRVIENGQLQIQSLFWSNKSTIQILYDWFLRTGMVVMRVGGQYGGQLETELVDFSQNQIGVHRIHSGRLFGVRILENIRIVVPEHWNQMYPHVALIERFSERMIGSGEQIAGFDLRINFWPDQLLAFRAYLFD